MQLLESQKVDVVRTRIDDGPLRRADGDRPESTVEVGEGSGLTGPVPILADDLHFLLFLFSFPD